MLCDVKTNYDVEVTFPVAPFSVVLGFGLILITEQAVLHFQVLKQFGNRKFFVSNAFENRSNWW